jgi:hypothetical protein
MRNWTQLLSIALLAACGGSDKDPTNTADGNVDDVGDADTDADSDSDTDLECLATISGLDPEPGDAFVPLDQQVTVEFSDAVPAGGHYAVSIDGVPGATSLAADGLSMTFAPDAPFAPETSYTVDVEVCEDAQSATFTTLPPPVPVEAVEGNTYALPWDSITITQPTNPDALNALIPIDYVLLQIISIDPLSDLAPSAATVGTDDGYGNAIPDCSTVIEQDADFSLNPYYQFDGDLRITLDANATPPTYADVEDFHLQALVSDDGTIITEIGMSGLVAPEQFLAGLDCNNLLIQAMGATCEPCTISATGECMLLEGTAPSALVQPALDLVTTCGL